jgi:soluble lytic murein transglycosylase
VKIIFFSLLLTCLFCTTPQTLYANEYLEVTTDKNQQKLFIKAEKLTARSGSNQYKKLYNQLHYYPLQAYLDQKRLLHRMKLSDVKEIDAFLTRYESSPLDWPLRKKWLQYLHKKKQGALFLEYFKPTSNAKLTCQKHKFSLSAGIPESVVLPQITKLWVVGKSQDKACDPLFKRWQAAGYRTEDVIWQRVMLAADGGKHTLLPYLTKLLPEQEQYLGKLWHKIRRDPSKVSRLSYFPKKSAKEQQIYLYGIKRFIWKDQNRALKAYKKALPLFKFSPEQQQAVTERFALALASKNHPDANEWLNLLAPEKLNEKMMQWRLTQLLKQQDWQRIVNELDNIPAQHQSSLQWQYWYSRALTKTGSIEQGQTVMAKLAKQRHYYGFLAASHMKAPVNLQNKPLMITKKEKLNVINHPAAKRAFELFHIKRYNQARREWNFWLSQLSDRDKLVAAKVANENNWFDRAIFTLSQVGYMDDVALRFPSAYDGKLKRHASKHKINPAWAQAITRRESSFMSDAQSPVGARGLMQLMPGTAKQLKRGSVSRSYLFNAENNIKLGTKYLRMLLDKNKGNQVLATASYNAGPYRIKSWLKNAKALPADIWIETIPFKETRNYVKSVLAYQEIYQNEPGQVSTIFDEVINMSIGD